MKIITDILNRKKIEREVLNIITSHFSKLAIKKLLDEKDKKANKKLEQILSRLKAELRTYIVKKEMGIYGVSTTLKTVQNKLLAMGFETEMIKGMVENIMLG